MTIWAYATTQHRDQGATMVRIMTIVAALVATLLGAAPTATAQSQYAYFQNSIDAFAAESGLRPINWTYVGPGETVESACGLIRSDQALAFCMDDGVAYIGDDAAAWAAQFHHLAVAIAMSHESGHGFQKAAAGGKPVPAIQATEDGADCVAGAWLFWAPTSADSSP